MNQAKQQQLLEIVKNNYQEIAQDFDTTRKKVIWPTIAELAQGVKDGDRVLDVGCGNGRLLQVFADKRIEFVGTDLSSNLIKFAKMNAGTNIESSRVNYKFLVHDILELNTLDVGQFDWIFSHAVIHHLPGQSLQLKALENLKSKMKSGGRIVISVWRPWGNKKLVRELWKTIGRKIIGQHPYAWNDLVFEWKNNQSPRYYHFFTKCELKRLVKRAGLEIVVFKAEQRNYYLTLK